MLMLGPIGFAAPWVLTALIALPVLWILLRALPPAPRQVAFPGVALLRGLLDKVPVARRTPWWLLLLRLAAVAALILAFAGPSWKPVVPVGQGGPLLVVLDAGWAAAPDWPARLTRAEAALGNAAAQGRPAALLLADGRAAPGALPFAPADTLLAGLRAAQPMPWATGLPANPQAALANVPEGALETLWISDGLDHPNRGAWLEALTRRGAVTVVPPARAVRSLSLHAGDTPSLTLAATDETAPAILAIGPDPQGVERELARLTAGDAAVADGTWTRPAAIDLPPELRNRITRFQVEGEAHAGAVVLTDDRVKRRKVGLVGDADRQAEGQELLSQLHYLRRALNPTADVVEGGLGDVLDTAPDVIVLADQVDLAESAELAGWVEEGGLLIRFAGPRMAAFEDLQNEPLIPVPLRQGGRDIGGALSWGDPRTILPFAAEGVFAGLIPPEDVTIRAQLMAQPAPDLADRTLAALSDNTPLVTRSRQGQGQIVLFHVTANAEWSNLPISGLFVDMLNRLVQTARVAPADEVSEDRDQPFWTPETVLDGFGRAQPAEGMAPVPAADLARGTGPNRPAGIYAAGERRTALNAGGPMVRADWPGATVEAVGTTGGRDLTGILLALAALILAADALGSALLARGGRVAAAVLLALLIQPAPPLMAQDPNPELARAANEVALAYVVTGDERVDDASREGLRGLSVVLRQRTSVEPGEPVAIDLDRDDLSVLTFLYWPITDTQAAPSPQAYVRLNHFMRSGGMILFDTRDGDVAGVGGPDMSQALQALAAPLEIPPLSPIPADHVLTRSFYLLSDFPGRWQGNPVWLEAPPAGAETAEGMPFRQLNDGVSPVVIGGNSWAEAWAVDDNGYAAYPIGRGWEGEQQREMAFRFGVNLVMYVLTGNYKSDQVHVPALLDRMRTEETLGP
ncbi:DUF4159 domain-containing protein [Paracoccus sediminis]|uniref:DUF4159 domain-containing protein n=1 Tax=Paracoccus sediminis TaxID=1214787 RepID=A0A238WBR2_9RHOB|nr:DUF4159 domain-containing protein [Paracoccus sediminis]TBN50966.1 DUF4159 domain-containing protein [Paracoccus sediminis]SNR43857.1 N-terminal double-transmembrane domain-containing protein [Paracoccus sediminis]